MARIFITGSTTGLGYLAAGALINQGHQLVLHARNEEKAKQLMRKLPDAEGVLVADLSSMEETKRMAAAANASGAFDTVIHNAGVYNVASELTFAVNTMAPYILTCLMHQPKRLIYLSSGLHRQGSPYPGRLHPDRTNYSDSKLHVVILTMAVARKWPDVYANAVDPGWVPTNMGGPNATGDLEKGYQTQVWLAVSDDPEARVSGCYFYHQQKRNHLEIADEITVQEAFLARCGEISGVEFPAD